MYYVEDKMLDVSAASIGYRWCVYARHGRYENGRQTRRLLHSGWWFTEAGAHRRAMRAARWRTEWQQQLDHRLRTQPSRVR